MGLEAAEVAAAVNALGCVEGGMFFQELLLSSKKVVALRTKRDPLVARPGRSLAHQKADFKIFANRVRAFFA